MILGTSAFIYRKTATQTYLSKGLIEGQKVEPIRIDISLVNSAEELDVEGLKKWLPEFANATFELENGKCIVHREVEKMSKSKYNVVNPDEICDTFGADTLRMYEMFLGPIEQAKPWNTAGISGVHSFLKKLWRLYHPEDEFSVSTAPPSKAALKALHQTIKKVNEDIENFSFNTCISSFMICVNELSKLKCNEKAVLEPLTILLAPFAPHVSEELWEQLGHSGSISKAAFPIFDAKHVAESTKEYPVSFNGKMRFKHEFSLELGPKEIETLILKEEKTQQYLEGRTPKKVIVVPGKIINIVG